MSNTDIDQTETVLYITKINSLVTDGREDLIAAIIADYERGTGKPGRNLNPNSDAHPDHGWKR